MQDYRCNILLKNYINLNYIEKEKIRKYRNHPEIKKYLLNELKNYAKNNEYEEIQTHITQIYGI